MDTHGTPQTDRSIDARLARIEADLEGFAHDLRALMAPQDVTH